MAHLGARRDYGWDGVAGCYIEVLGERAVEGCAHVFCVCWALVVGCGVVLWGQYQEAVNPKKTPEAKSQ